MIWRCGHCDATRETHRAARECCKGKGQLQGWEAFLGYHVPRHGPASPVAEVIDLDAVRKSKRGT